MPVQMDRVDVIARVAHTQPIPLALLQVECGWCYFVRHRVSDSVDRPPVEAVLRSIIFREGHFEGFVWRRRGRARFREPSVVPLETRRRNPLRFSGAPGVLQNDAHAMAAILIGEISENPYTRMSHVHDGRDP